MHSHYFLHHLVGYLSPSVYLNHSDQFKWLFISKLFSDLGVWSQGWTKDRFIDWPNRKNLKLQPGPVFRLPENLIDEAKKWQLS